ncbi:MAG: FHA domain-containing protein [Patescibacteria group bacterium]|nr:FHA domain-containing protein [Patescibacteria group bacterium]
MAKRLSRRESPRSQFSEVVVLGKEITLLPDTTITIGSDPSSHIRVENDPAVEPKHVRIAATDQGVVACDMSQNRSTKVMIGGYERGMAWRGAQVVPKGAIIELGDDSFIQVTRNDEGAWGLVQITKEEAIGNKLNAEQEFKQGVVDLIRAVGIEVPIYRDERDPQGAHHAELSLREQIERALDDREPGFCVVFTHAEPPSRREILRVKRGEPTKLTQGKTVYLGTEGHIRPMGNTKGVSRLHLHLASSSEGVTVMDRSTNGTTVYIGGKSTKLTKELPVSIPNGAIIQLMPSIFYRIRQRDDGQYELLEFDPKLAEDLLQNFDSIAQQEENIYRSSIVSLIESHGLGVPVASNVSGSLLSLREQVLEAIDKPRGWPLPYSYSWPGMPARVGKSAS